jgi:hypothetical protein
MDHLEEVETVEGDKVLLLKSEVKPISKTDSEAISNDEASLQLGTFVKGNTLTLCLQHLPGLWLALGRETSSLEGEKEASRPRGFTVCNSCRAGSSFQSQEDPLILLQDKGSAWTPLRRNICLPSTSALGSKESSRDDSPMCLSSPWAQGPVVILSVEHSPLCVREHA